ncbi:MAG: aspartate/glutamate racemase family protein [Candidatus Methylomirabilales bacterium]
MRDSAAVGVLMLDTRFPRLPGDIGNPATFPFPVHYRRIAGATADRVVRRKPGDLLPAFISGARELEAQGVVAITTTCGFLARFQRELAAAVRVPVCTSSLMLVPLVHRMLPAQAAVGILTIDASALGGEELAGAGIAPDMPVVVAGLEGEAEFARAILEDRPTLDGDAARQEHVRVAQRLAAAHPEVRAIVLECTNMPPYRDAIRVGTGLPVFDIVHLVTLLRQASLPAAHRIRHRAGGPAGDRR